MATSKKYLPDTIRKKIIVMAAGGSEVVDIMSSTSQTAATISKVCAEAGIRIARHPKKMTDVKRREIMDNYMTGMSTAENACKTGMSLTAVRNAIRDAKAVKPKRMQEPEQPVQLTLDVTESAKDKQYEALLMMREAINMLIEARLS